MTWAEEEAFAPSCCAGRPEAGCPGRRRCVYPMNPRAAGESGVHRTPSGIRAVTCRRLRSIPASLQRLWESGGETDVGWMHGQSPSCVVANRQPRLCVYDSIVNGTFSRSPQRYTTSIINHRPYKDRRCIDTSAGGRRASAALIGQFQHVLLSTLVSDWPIRISSTIMRVYSRPLPKTSLLTVTICHYNAQVNVGTCIYSIQCRFLL